MKDFHCAMVAVVCAFFFFTGIITRHWRQEPYVVYDRYNRAMAVRLRNMRHAQSIGPLRFQLPAVQLIGAEKAGITAIAEWMTRYGDFHGPRTYPGEPPFYSKESHFFDNSGNYNRGIKYYSDRFLGFPHNAMDASPGTIWQAARVRNIYDQGGGNQTGRLKIIVSLREPVARELSPYNMLQYEWRTDVSWKGDWHRQVIKEDGKTVMSFDEFVNRVTVPAMKQPSNVRGSSSQSPRYAVYLKEWFELFDRSQILVLNYDELKSDPNTFQERIVEFLGHDIKGNIPRSNTATDPHKVRYPSPYACGILSKLYNAHNENLYKLMDTYQYGAPHAEEHPFRRFYPAC